MTASLALQLSYFTAPRAAESLRQTGTVIDDSLGNMKFRVRTGPSLDQQSSYTRPLQPSFAGAALAAVGVVVHHPVRRNSCQPHVWLSALRTKQPLLPAWPRTLDVSYQTVEVPERLTQPAPQVLELLDPLPPVGQELVNPLADERPTDARSAAARNFLCFLVREHGRS